MKKLMLGFAASALILASCSQNEILEKETSENLIGFSTLNDRITPKTANDASSNYGVYSVRSTASTVWFMNNLKIKGDDNTYSPAYYWPTTGTVSFYAYAPESSTNAAITATTAGSLPVVYTVPANADEDFTIATPVTASTGNVALSFNHMLTKITVSAQLTTALQTAGYTVDFTSASLTVEKNVGEGNIATGITDLTPSGSSTTYSGKKVYLFMPQDAIDAVIQLKGVTIKHNTENYWTGDLKAYKIVAGNVTTGNKFERNTHYAVAFTIDHNAKDGTVPANPVFGNAITFTAGTTLWTDGSININQPGN